MDAIGARGPVYIDGPFAKNAAFLKAMMHRQIHDGIESGVVAGIERLLA